MIYDMMVGNKQLPTCYTVIVYSAILEECMWRTRIHLFGDQEPSVHRSCIHRASAMVSVKTHKRRTGDPVTLKMLLR